MVRVAPIPRLMLLLTIVLWLVVLPASAAEELLDPRSGERQTIEIGAPVLHLVFFATWCPDCLDEIPALTELNARWSDQGYRLIVVAVKSRHDAGRLKAFVNEGDLALRLLWDVDGSAARRFKAESVPLHLVLDSNGKELARSSKLDDRVLDAVAAAVDKRRRPRGQR
jgi:thiol-disulfide isomerase/thioredoxin